MQKSGKAVVAGMVLICLGLFAGGCGKQEDPKGAAVRQITAKNVTEKASEQAKAVIRVKEKVEAMCQGRSGSQGKGRRRSKTESGSGGQGKSGSGRSCQKKERTARAGAKRTEATGTAVNGRKLWCGRCPE